MVALIGTSVGSLIAIGANQRNDDQPTQGGLSNQHKSAMGQTHSVLQRHAGMAFPLAGIGPLSWRDNRLKSRVLAMGCSPHSKNQEDRLVGRESGLHRQLNSQAFLLFADVNCDLDGNPHAKTASLGSALQANLCPGRAVDAPAECPAGTSTEAVPSSVRTGIAALKIVSHGTDARWPTRSAPCACPSGCCHRFAAIVISRSARSQF